MAFYSVIIRYAKALAGDKQPVKTSRVFSANASRGERRRGAASMIWALAFAWLWTPSSSSAAQYNLTQTGFRVLYMAPIFAAIDKGFFAEHGVSLVFREIDSGALGPASVLSGSAQISDLDPGGLAMLAAHGKAPLMIYNLVDRVTLDLIVRNDALTKSGVKLDAPVMERAKALKSMSLGITRPGAATDTYARYFIAKAGLEPTRDANLVQIGSIPALEAAFRSGRIDGFFLSPPLPQKLESEGLGKIVIRNSAGEVPALTDVSFDALFTTADFAAANGPALAAYCAAVREGVRWLDAHPGEAVDFLAAKWFRDTDKATLKLSLEALLPAVSETGAFKADSVSKYMDVLATLGQATDANIGEDALWTNRFAPSH